MLSVIMVSGIMMSVFKLSVIMLSDFQLSVIILRGIMPSDLRLSVGVHNVIGALKTLYKEF
jgi:hypothetical protein